MFHPSPETLQAFARGQLPYLSTSDVILHLRQCPDCQSAFAEARESHLIEEELSRHSVSS
jgi:hypothetical protein